MALAEYFDAHIIPEPNSGCWLWTGADNGEGYGTACVGGKIKKAHRVAYEFFCGEIPKGLQIDHLCRVRCCVNPNHLEPVTQKENMRRGIVWERARKYHAAITHCVNGHPFDKKNTRITTSGRRLCRACHRGRENARYAAKIGGR